MQANTERGPATRDYDVHGLLGVRVIPHRPGDGATVARLLGPMQTALSREPDIIIRFVDSIPTPPGIRYVGFDAGFTEDRFLLFRAGRMDEPRVQFAFEELGGSTEILCRSGDTVPLLLPIFNLSLLSRGVLPLHAAAFTYDGVGVLVTGWAKGGKTETLLAFAARGAQFIGDEWIYIKDDGAQLFGLPMPVRVWDWHLDEMPHYQQQIPRATRMWWRTIRASLNITDGVTARYPRSGPARVFSAVEPALQDRLSTFITPERLDTSGAPPLQGPLDKVLFATSYGASDIRVQRVPPSEIADRMAFSLDYERLPLLSRYAAFRFAFPDRVNKWIDCAHEVEHKLLTRAFEDKDAIEVRHPYPFSLTTLFERISPYVTK